MGIHPRQRLQLSALCVLTTLIGISLLFTSDDPEDKVVDRVKALGGAVYRQPSRWSRLANSLGIDLQIGSIRSISVDSTQVTDSDLELFCSLSELQTLQLDHPAITDSGLQRLDRLTKLEYLGICNSRITGDGLVAVVKLPALRRLIVVDTPINDASLDHISQLKRLEQLNLSGTAITSVGVIKLQQLDHLKYLDVSRTEVSLQDFKGLPDFGRRALIYGVRPRTWVIVSSDPAADVQVLMGEAVDQNDLEDLHRQLPYVDFEVRTPFAGAVTTSQ